MPLISVIIPAFNSEHTICETVDSVLRQTFQDFELIVIDDGSKDSTISKLAAVQDLRLKVFSYPNAGPSTSRNRGFERSRGKFVSFLDADDLWTPDKLELQLNMLRENPDAVVAYSWTDFIGESGERLGYGIYQTENGYVFPNLLTSNFIGSGSNALIHSTVFEKIGGFDESVIYGEERDLFLRLAANYHFVAVPKVQILYRFAETSRSRNVLHHESQLLKVIERVYSQDPGKSLQHLKKYSYAELYLYLASCALMGTSSRQKGLLAAKFLWLSFINNPRIIKQTSYVITLIFKMATVIVLSPQQAQAFRAKIKSFFR